MEKKKQLSNVAFGGNWSEEILRMDELNAVLNTIQDAVINTKERDVETEELHRAMLYVRKHVEKGPLICEAWFKAMRIQDQDARQLRLVEIYKMVRIWAGVDIEGVTGIDF